MTAQAAPAVRDWVLEKLAAAADRTRVLVRDPLRLLPEADAALHAFARDHGYTVIVASTNLVFRELYERALADRETGKLLVGQRQACLFQADVLELRGERAQL